MENILRIDRQQGSGAAEHHGEEIERDGTEDHLTAPDETDARKDLNEFRTKGLRIKLDNTKLSRPNDSVGQQNKTTEFSPDKNKKDQTTITGL